MVEKEAWETNVASKIRFLIDSGLSFKFTICNLGLIKIFKFLK